jgi:hypothetical protein
MDGIASRLGIATASLEQLLSGRVANDVASRLRTSTEALQQFIDGRETAPGLAWTIGGNVDLMRQLRDRIGRDGAIGLIIGLLEKRE